MKKSTIKQLGIGAASVVGIVSLGIVPASALAQTAASTTKANANNQATINNIITRGNTEISRRLTSLNGLSAKVSGATKLLASDKASLSDEVNSEVSGLTSLKSKLDADTDVSTARSDAQSIFNDYRVYALVVPKVNLVKTADDQQVAEAKYTTLAGNLQSRVAGNASLQAKLSDLTTQTNAAQAISSQIESSVVGLQPSDYNSNHAVLSGDRDKLKQAQSDLANAHTDAQAIINGLKS